MGFRDDAGEITHHFKLQRASGLSGIVRGPHGKPLVGAVVALTNHSLKPRISDGKIDAFFLTRGVTAETGPDGRFEFRPQEEPSGIIVVADEGFARRSPEQLANSVGVRVEPWGRVEGTCRVGIRPVAHQKIRLFVDATSKTSTDYEFYEYEAETDEQGRFVVERVFPGDARATTATPQGTNRGAYGSIGSDTIEIKSGETAKVTIGGRGRPVIGRLILPGGNVLPLNLAAGRGSLSVKIGAPKMPLPERFLNVGPRAQASLLTRLVHVARSEGLTPGDARKWAQDRVRWLVPCRGRHPRLVRADGKRGGAEPGSGVRAKRP